MRKQSNMLMLLEREKGIRHLQFMIAALTVVLVILLGLINPGSASALSVPGLATGNITSVAGNGNQGSDGDNGPATSAQLYSPSSVAVDCTGNIYIANGGQRRVRKVDTSGNITTVAGTGEKGYSGDKGPATSAKFKTISGVAVDSAGNLFIADSGNYCIREVAATNGTQYGIDMIAGNIYTIAGNGKKGYSGDKGPATDASLYVSAVAVDAEHNLFIVDSTNHCLRVVTAISGTRYGIDMTAGYIYSLAGTGTGGFNGDGIKATTAQLNNPSGVALDNTGNVYIADGDNFLIREIPASTDTQYGINMTAGYIYTIAGNRTQGHSGDGGPATSAQMYINSGIAVDSAGNLFLAEKADAYIRKVDSSGIITTISGKGYSDHSGDGGPASSAGLDARNGVAVNSAGNLYIPESSNRYVRFIQLAPVTSPTLATVSMTSSPTLTYNGPPFTYDLGKLSLAGYDQYGAAFDITGKKISWAIKSGSGSISDSSLTISNSGTVVVTASVVGDTGSIIGCGDLSLIVDRADPLLTSLTLGGGPDLSYSGSSCTYDLSGLTLTGSDQFGATFDVSGQSVTWVVDSGPATVTGSTLTVTGCGSIGVTATISGVASNLLNINVSDAAKLLNSLTLSGDQPRLNYKGSPLSYDLSGLSLNGTDQNGYNFDLTGKTVIWTVNAGPATVEDSNLTVTASGVVYLTATIKGITSNVFRLMVADNNRATMLTVRCIDADGNCILTKTYTTDELYAMNLTQQAYTFIDSMPTYVIESAKGVMLTELVADAGIDINSVDKFTFKAVDGLIAINTKANFIDTPCYYYPNLASHWDPDKNVPTAGAEDDAIRVYPMLALEENWQRKATGPDYSSMDNSTAFRELFGQKSPDEQKANNSLKWVCELDIKLISTIAATGVSLNQSKASLSTGSTMQLTASISPPIASNQTVNWSTSESLVATVDSSGLVTAVAAGIATITARTIDGNFTDTCLVTVTNNNEGSITGQYTVVPVTDSSYESASTSAGVQTMTVKSGISGLKYFTVNITPVQPHSGQETVVFTQLREGVQLTINVTCADFDLNTTAMAGFNVQAGDVIKAYIIDELSSVIDANPTMLQ